MRVALQCTAQVRGGSVSCKSTATTDANGVSKVLIGGQNQNVTLTSSNVSYDGGTELFEFDVTVQNLMNEAIGTPDGTVPDPDGIQVFFNQAPVATGGSGTISVLNEDGNGTFTSTNQDFYAYHQVLAQNQVSAPKTWQFSIPTTVTSFSFNVFIETDVQYLIVINELAANPVGAPPTGISDANGEWVELYNAGTRSVNLQNLVIADSAISGRRPYHLISSSVPIAPGGYVVIGQLTNTANNGGVPVDYSYGGTVAFANSLDAFKISRVYGTDTLTIDRTQYASAGLSAADGISRELINPALDNSNMDGSNWALALSTSTYGSLGARGTPKAQNSTFTP